MTDSGSKTMSEIAVESPAMIGVLEKYRLDFCRDGDKSLEAAAAEAGVPLETVLSEMRLALTQCRAEQADWNTAGLDVLMQHIVVRHHAYLRKELPLLERLLARAREARGRADANTLAPLEKVFRFFKRELENHLRREEEVLFPLIRQLETASKSGAKLPRFPFGPIANPIGIMEEDHDAERRQMQKMLVFTGNYTGPAETANAFHSLFERLEALESDMRLHVHLEDHILFPRAGALENSSW
jgi:regulator of cell morphogenesis and NO signaling